MPREIALPVAIDVQSTTMRGPLTGSFHTPVWTVALRHGTSLGRPTFTASSLATLALVTSGLPLRNRPDHRPKRLSSSSWSG
jgi:hypothetical protein